MSSGTTSLSGKNAGRPTTQIAPRTAPATDPSPPITTMANEQGRVRHGEVAGRGDALDVGGQRGPAQRGDAAGQGEGPQLRGWPTP